MLKKKVGQHVIHITNLSFFPFRELWNPLYGENHIKRN